MGAYGLTVAAAFAVALAVLVSVSSTPAEADVYDSADVSAGTALAGDGLTRNNGDTVYISNNDGSDTVYVDFTIETVGAASASFTHSSATDDGQSILCNAGGKCDADPTDTGSVTVALKIDDDSEAGAIFVRQATVAATPTNSLDTITVEVAQVPTNLSAKASPETISAGEGSAEAGTSTLTFRLTDSNGKGIGEKALTVIASHGELSAADAAPDSWTDATDGIAFTGSGTQVGTVTTSTDGGAEDADGAGHAAVTFTAGGVADIATITVRLSGSTISNTVDITMFGAVKTITAESEQSAIEVTGKTLIVVTARDAGGNPVADHTVAVKSGATGVVGPSTTGNKVVVSNTVNKDGGTIGALTDKGDIPACGTVPAVTAAPDADPPVVGVAASTGTNGEGQCVFQVDAGSASGTADDAARGTHTITIAGPKADGSADVKVEIAVGGAPDDITSDAPERIAPSDEITVNLTVVDNEGVRVGKTTIEVLKTAGDGALLAEPTSTSDGRAKFTYLAPSTPGVVDLLVRTKSPTGTVTAKLAIIIQIAAEEPEEPDEPAMPDEPSMPEGGATLSGSSGLVIFSGGSLDDLEAAALAHCSGGAAIWLNDGAGSYVLFPAGAAIAAAQAPARAVYPGAIEGPAAVNITVCEQDAMEDEG